MITFTHRWTNYNLVVKGHCDRTKHIFGICKHSSSETARGNFLKIGTNFHLDLKMNWLDFAGQKHVTPYFCELDIIKSALQEFDYTWHKHWLGHKDEEIRTWVSKVKSPATLRTLLPFEHLISRENPFKFGTNVHSDSQINWLYFRGQKSR